VEQATGLWAEAARLGPLSAAAAAASWSASSSLSRRAFRSGRAIAQ